MPVILKVLEGPDAGAHVVLSKGETVVGTGTRASLRLTSPTASVEHFVVNQGEDTFYIENLSARGTQVNDVKISGKVKLRLRDKIRVSEDTVIRLETEGGDSIITQYRTLVIALVAVLIIAGLLLIFLDPFSTPPAKADWDRTYNSLSTFVNRQKIYPIELKRSWTAAWNKDRAAKSTNDFKAVAQEWLALQVALLKFEKLGNVEESNKAFEKFLRNAKPDDYVENHPDQVGQILVEFVNQRYNNAMKKSEQKQGLTD